MAGPSVGPSSHRRPRRLLLVNGLPGSGKTTLAGRLASARQLPLIAKDALKEAIAAAAPGVPSSAVGVAASELMWELAAATPGDVILESWWFRPHDLGFVTAGLDRCGAPATVEIWCDVPADVALARYRSRRRSAVHEDDRKLRDWWPRWAADAEPLRVGPTVVVRTDGPVDIDHLVDRIGTATGRPG